MVRKHYFLLQTGLKDVSLCRYKPCGAVFGIKSKYCCLWVVRPEGQSLEFIRYCFELVPNLMAESCQSRYNNNCYESQNKCIFDQTLAFFPQ